MGDDLKAFVDAYDGDVDAGDQEIDHLLGMMK